MGGDANVRMRARRPAMGVAAWCMALIFSALFVLPIVATDAEQALSGEALGSKTPLGEGMTADEARLVEKEAATKKVANEAVQKLRNYRKKAQQVSRNVATTKAANGRNTHKKAKKGKKKLGKNYDNTDERTKWKAKRIRKGKPPWTYTGAKNRWHAPLWRIFMPPRS